MILSEANVMIRYISCALGYHWYLVSLGLMQCAKAEPYLECEMTCTSAASIFSLKVLLPNNGERDILLLLLITCEPKKLLYAENLTFCAVKANRLLLLLLRTILRMQSAPQFVNSKSLIVLRQFLQVKDDVKFIKLFLTR